MIVSSLAFIKVCDGLPAWGEGGLLQEPQGLVNAGDRSWGSNSGTVLPCMRGSIAESPGMRLKWFWVTAFYRVSDFTQRVILRAPPGIRVGWLCSELLAVYNVQKYKISFGRSEHGLGDGILTRNI
eukprot:11079824-Heterocapsa_arctica.AAC.1